MVGVGGGKVGLQVEGWQQNFDVVFRQRTAVLSMSQYSTVQMYLTTQNQKQHPSTPQLTLFSPNSNNLSTPSNHTLSFRNGDPNPLIKSTKIWKKSRTSTRSKLCLPFFLSKLFKAALTDIKSIGQMQNYLERLKSWITSPKGIIISVSSIALITATRLYFRGGVCKADRDLTGKIVVITGGNTGIGKATVEELAKRNCTIIFGARDERKSEEAIKDILSRNKQAKIMQFKLDLSDKDSIKEFSLKVKEQCERIDILINNAAVMALPQREITANGFEMQMGVNHFGHFYLTYLLWDRIRNTEKARIINVSSKAHMGFGYPKSNLVIDFNDINFRNGYNPGVSYGRSKAANILFTKELQRRIDESGLDITTYCLHPGVVRTELSRYMGWKIIFAKVFLAPFAYLMMKNPLQGAQTTLYTALEDESKLTKAAYYADCQVAPNTEFTSSVENGQHLWMLTEQQLGIEFNV